MLSDKKMLIAPRVAWPTLLVLAAAIGCWAAGFWLGASHRVPAAVAVALATLGAYAAFTPLHEAAHRSLARSWALCEILGRVAAVPLLGPFAVVRRLHLEHHKHTNDPERDPDFWSGRGPTWLLPLRWCTQDLHYYGRVLGSWRSVGKTERVDAIVTLSLYLVAGVVVTAIGYGTAALLYWVLPARLAVTFLAYAFDYLPHRPHSVRGRDDRHRATSVIDSAVLHVLFLGQSHHLVHHLNPGVPFYRYRSIWKRERARLLELGAIEGRRPRPSLG